MIEQAPERNVDQEPGTPSWEELASASEVMRAVVKTAKGLRIYLPNNPVLIRFLEELNARMAGHIARYGDFKLDVEQFALRYKRTDIYQNRDPRESIAFRIHSDGIRSILFAEGLEQRELNVFLGIIGFEQPSHQDDDIVTQLWERSLPHITYLLEDDFVEIDREEEEIGAGSQQEAISRIYADIAENTPHPPRMVPRHLLMLTGEEAILLRKAKHAEAHRTPVDDIVNILSAVLTGVKDPAIFEEYVEITATLTVKMFFVGEIGHALRLLRFLDQLVKHADTHPDQRQVVSAALAGILSEKTVHVLQEVIDTGESVSHEELSELLQILGLPSLGAICELLGRVEKLKMRKVIVEVLVELGRANPEVFAPFLSDPRWYLVRNMVLVLSLLDNTVALEMIVRMVSHKEARIRKEVLGYLERSPDPRAKPYILKFFRDESSALRIRALQILTRERLPFALKPALALTSAEDFKNRDLAEKKAVFEVIGEIGSEEMVPLFREMLLKKRWFKKSPDKDSAVCAVAGLLRIRNAAALQLLEEARNQRNVEICWIIDQAISAIGTGPLRATAGPGEF